MKKLKILKVSSFVTTQNLKEKSTIAGKGNICLSKISDEPGHLYFNTCQALHSEGCPSYYYTCQRP